MTRRVALVAVVAVAGCFRGRGDVPPPASVDAQARGVYRTVAESLYVRSTGRPVAIVQEAADTTCAGSGCDGLLARWGMDRAWWPGADSSAHRAASSDLLRRLGRSLDVGGLFDAHRRLVPTVAANVPARGAPVEEWVRFRDEHGGVSGALRFSPIGYDARTRTAVVFVDWRCGPRCGHQVSAALRATGDTTFAILDMLLLPAGGQ